MTTVTANEEMDWIRRAAQQDVQNLRQQIGRLDEASLDLILTRARSHYAWKDVPVTDDQIRQMYDIVKMGATSMNSCPARFVFRGVNIVNLGCKKLLGRRGKKIQVS